LKTLLILRHAKSNWHTALGDHDRPLNARGERDAPRMGLWVRAQHLTPDLILSSDAVRARMTAEEVARACNYGRDIAFEPLLYLATPDDIIGVLRTTLGGDPQTVMVVGHNPGLEDLLARLTGEEEDLPTAALAHVVLPIARWRDLTRDTRGTLVELYRPKDLP
jgi:phosphohistidine phosphatase